MSAPTPAQIAYATDLGCFRADMDFDECSQAIDEAKARRREQITRKIEDARAVNIESVLGAHSLKGKHYLVGPCPFCHDPKNDDRFVVSLSKNAWLCRVCTNTVYKSPIDFVMRRDSVSFIQAVLTLTGGDYAVNLEWQARTKQEAPWEQPWWLKQSLARYHVPQRFAAWQAHKPLTRATIEAHKLGLGIVPYCSCQHPRLIVPVFEAGQLVSLRGRRLECDCKAKWISCKGPKNALYGLDDVVASGVLWIVANNVDALLFRQACPEWRAVSPTMGEGSWRDEWSARIAELAPSQLVIAYDNDEAGYRASVKVAAKLKAVGLAPRVWEWAPGTPPKADVGWLLSQKGEAA